MDPLPPSLRTTRPTRGRSALATIDRLHLAAAAPLTGALGRPLDVAHLTAPFQRAVDDLRARAAGRPVRAPTGATLDRAVARWAECRPDVSALGSRYVRTLCAHPPTVRDPAFVAGIAAHPELAERRRWLESLVSTYEAEWRPPNTADALERLLRGTIAGTRVRSARLDRLRPVAARHFSPDAARALADAAVRARAAVTTMLAQYGVAADSALARAAVEAGARIWADQLVGHRGDSAAAGGLLAYGLKDLLPEHVLAPAPLAEVAGRVIEWLPERDERLMPTLRDWLLGDPRFGDPRLPANQPKWATLPSAARERMIRWLAKGDLLFFFDFVMDHVHDPHGRKQFWLQYIDQVDDCVIALSDDDSRRLKLTVTQSLRYARAIGPLRNVSAFLFRFGGPNGTIAVEFSQVGNAYFLHNAARFDKVMRGWRRPLYQIEELKRGPSLLVREPHNPVPGWMTKAADHLLRLGVRRGARWP